MAADEKLSADLAAPEIQHGVDQGFWQLDSQDGTMLRFRVYAADNRSYYLQLDCAGYGERPIAGQFVDQNGTSFTPAWPTGNDVFAGWIKFQGPPHFICWDQDRIAIEQHHRDWEVRAAWKRKNQLLAYLNFIRELLHLATRGYTRRPEPDNTTWPSLERST